jgi:hypothetical protein
MCVDVTAQGPPLPSLSAANPISERWSGNLRTKYNVTKTLRFVVCVVAGLSLIGSAKADSIQHPIADYLTMKVPERTEYIGTLDHVDCAKIDVDGDGKDEVFVGSPYKYSGTMEVFWVGYRPVERGYQRITPADEDIMIGSFEDIYAGPLTEIATQGLATADDIEVDNPESGNVTKVGMLRFYYIANDRLVVEERGALDLAVPEQKAIYERYFGKDRVTRTATIETLGREQLETMGYTIPNWEPPSP